MYHDEYWLNYKYTHDLCPLFKNISTFLFKKLVTILFDFLKMFLNYITGVEIF